MYQQPFRSQEYRQHDVLGASPLRLVVMAYDLAIQSCHRKDFEKATRAISVLRDALNFEYQDVALGLFRVSMVPGLHSPGRLRQRNFCA
jgi:hypothetical protein